MASFYRLPDEEAPIETRSPITATFSSYCFFPVSFCFSLRPSVLFDCFSIYAGCPAVWVVHRFGVFWFLTHSSLLSALEHGSVYDLRLN